ncbi:MAG: hypothetical protein EBU90_01615 [Proteobacteria bacterium]|nr:hypothetical protein [Pseudomonadota bacterium]
MNFIKSLLASFDTRTKGFSARKLSAFGYFCLSAFLHFIMFITGKTEFLFYFLIVDTAAVLSLLAVITLQSVVDKYAGNKSAKDESNTEQ